MSPGILPLMRVLFRDIPASPSLSPLSLYLCVCRDVQKAIAGQPAAQSGNVPQYQQGESYWDSQRCSGCGPCWLQSEGLFVCVHRSEHTPFQTSSPKITDPAAPCLLSGPTLPATSSPGAVPTPAPTARVSSTRYVTTAAIRTV